VSRRLYILAAFVSLSMGMIECVGDSSVPPPDASTDATTQDVVNDVGADVQPKDSAADTFVEAEPPCVDAGPPQVLPSTSSVQCQSDGGLAFCGNITPSECCGTAQGTLHCVAKSAGCGTETTFECDKISDCDGSACCLKAPSKSLQCAGRVFQSQGTYCAPAGCPGSDIQICNGGICGGGTCTELQLETYPGKILSGCL
jgi:hypothetical protein